MQTATHTFGSRSLRVASMVFQLGIDRDTQALEDLKKLPNMNVVAVNHLVQEIQQYTSERDAAEAKLVSLITDGCDM
jgi:hypothetical protein